MSWPRGVSDGIRRCSATGARADVLLHRTRRRTVVQPPLRQRHPSRTALAAARRAQLVTWVRRGVVQRRQQPAEALEISDQSQPPPEVTTRRKALEVPGDVLAELLAA